MSDKHKFPLAEARAVAEQLMAALYSASSRIIIAGSIRREKAEVGDIELLYVPKTETMPAPGDFLTTMEVNLVDAKLASLLEYGIIEERPNVNGQTTWGPKNKLARHVASGIPVDFFCTSLENWWVSLVIRTGSKDFNLRLTTGAQKLGGSLNAYGSGVTKNDGRKFTAFSEKDVCDLCGIPFLDPKDR